MWFSYQMAQAKFIHEHLRPYDEGLLGVVVPAFEEGLAGHWMLVQSGENNLQHTENALSFVVWAGANPNRSVKG